MLAESEKAMKEMLKRMRKYLREKKLALNADKSKMVVFKNERRQKDRKVWY